MNPLSPWERAGVRHQTAKFKKDLPMTINLKNRNFLKLLDYTPAEIST